MTPDIRGAWFLTLLEPCGRAFPLNPRTRSWQGESGKWLCGVNAGGYFFGMMPTTSATDVPRIFADAILA
jgi:hypothetical protein